MAIGAFISAVASLASRAINQNESDRVRREQNIFNKYEAQRAREWNQQMDSTKYQRTVADMQAAGVNPALAMQGGVTTQASSNATASAANVGPAQIDLSQVAQLAMQSQALKIQDKLANAEIRLKNADADLKEKDAKVRDDYNNLMMEGMKISNNLNEAQINQVRANIAKIGEEVELLRKQAATEEERRLLTAAETSLRKAMENKTDQEIKNMVALLPFQQALMSAQTESAKASAAAQFVHAAYEQGLIDSGYITAMVREQNASADEKEVRKTAEEYEYLIKSGNIFDTSKTSGKIAKNMMTAANVMSRLFGGINQGLIGSVAKAMAK
ncbi:DNA pilot protein [Microvirus sp.]|nr:DNA pilot protein [Microvirus sp.]